MSGVFNALCHHYSVDLVSRYDDDGPNKDVAIVEPMFLSVYHSDISSRMSKTFPVLGVIGRFMIIHNETKQIKPKLIYHEGRRKLVIFFKKHLFISNVLRRSHQTAAPVKRTPGHVTVFLQVLVKLLIIDVGSCYYQ